MCKFSLILPNENNYITVREIPELTAGAIYSNSGNLAECTNYWSLVEENNKTIARMMLKGELITLDPLTYRQDSGMAFGDAGLNRLITIEEFTRLCKDWGINVFPPVRYQDIRPLIELTAEERQSYIDNSYEWDIYNAIFILQGYKPPEQDLSSQTAGHFAHLIDYFSRAFRAGEIGRKVTHCGESIIVDSPENWQSFWKTVKINPDWQAEATTPQESSGKNNEKLIGSTQSNRPERELKLGLREIWEKEGKPEMKIFFPDKLKKYINKSGSPVTAVYSAGVDAGIGYKTSYGTTGSIKKKTISNYVTEFKKKP